MHAQQAVLYGCWAQWLHGAVLCGPRCVYGPCLPAVAPQDQPTVPGCRWGDNATAAAAATEAQLDGLASIPQNWPQLLSPVQQGEEHTWWQVQLPAANSTRR